MARWTVVVLCEAAFVLLVLLVPASGWAVGTGLVFMSVAWILITGTGREAPPAVLLPLFVANAAFATVHTLLFINTDVMDKVASAYDKVARTEPGEEGKAISERLNDVKTAADAKLLGRTAPNSKVLVDNGIFQSLANRFYPTKKPGDSQSAAALEAARASLHSADTKQSESDPIRPGFVAIFLGPKPTVHRQWLDRRRVSEVLTYRPPVQNTFELLQKVVEHSRQAASLETFAQDMRAFREEAQKQDRPYRELALAIENTKAELKASTRTAGLYSAVRFHQVINGGEDDQGWIQKATIFAFWIGILVGLRALAQLPYSAARVGVIVRKQPQNRWDALRPSVLTFLLTAAVGIPSLYFLPLLGYTVIVLGGAWVIAAAAMYPTRWTTDLRGVLLLDREAVDLVHAVNRANAKPFTDQGMRNELVRKFEVGTRLGGHTPWLLGTIDRVLNAAIVSGTQEAMRSVLAQASAERREQTETGLEFCRYVAWLIPAIGFIGTILGIGEGLLRSERMVNAPPEKQGQEITGVTDMLGLAFDTTLVALVLSMGVVLLIHLTIYFSEYLIDGGRRFCDEKLIQRFNEADGDAGYFKNPSKVQVHRNSAGNPIRVEWTSSGNQMAYSGAVCLHEGGEWGVVMASGVLHVTYPKGTQV